MAPFHAQLGLLVGGQPCDPLVQRGVRVAIAAAEAMTLLLAGKRIQGARQSR